MNNFNTDICLICGDTTINIIKKHLRNDYSLGNCAACNFKFAQPRPTIEFLINYYNSISSVRFYKHPAEEAIRDSKPLFNLITKYKPDTKTVLEIGCSTGYYLYGLKLRGFEVVGSELSMDAVKLGKEWYNLELYPDEFPPEEYYNKFDVVIIYHVIEHVRNPKEFLEMASRYMINSGLLLIETPNIDSIGIKIFNKNYPVLCPPGHLNFFNLDTLEKTLPSGVNLVNGITTSDSNTTFYNSVVAVISLFKTKKLLDSIISRQIEVKDTNQQVIKTNRKYYFNKMLTKISIIVHYIFFPFFFFYDKISIGENIRVVTKKNSEQ